MRRPAAPKPPIPEERARLDFRWIDRAAASRHLRRACRPKPDKASTPLLGFYRERYGKRRPVGERRLSRASQPDALAALQGERISPVRRDLETRGLCAADSRSFRARHIVSGSIYGAQADGARAIKSDLPELSLLERERLNVQRRTNAVMIGDRKYDIRSARRRSASWRSARYMQGLRRCAHGGIGRGRATDLLIETPTPNPRCGRDGVCVGAAEPGRERQSCDTSRSPVSGQSDPIIDPAGCARTARERIQPELSATPWPGYCSVVDAME